MEMTLTPDDVDDIAWLNKILATNTPHRHHGLWFRNGKHGLVAYAMAFGVMLNVNEDDIDGALDHEWAFLPPRQAKAAQQVLRGKADRPAQNVGVQSIDPEDLASRFFVSRRKYSARAIRDIMRSPLEQYVDVPKGTKELPEWPHFMLEDGKAWQVENRRIVGEPVMYNPPMVGRGAFTKKLFKTAADNRLIKQPGSPYWAFADEDRMGLIMQLIVEG